jgi:hypothetical protein
MLIFSPSFKNWIWRRWDHRSVPYGNTTFEFWISYGCLIPCAAGTVNDLPCWKELKGAATVRLASRCRAGLPDLPGLIESFRARLPTPLPLLWWLPWCVCLIPVDPVCFHGASARFRFTLNHRVARRCLACQDGQLIASESCSPLLRIIVPSSLNNNNNKKILTQMVKWKTLFGPVTVIDHINSQSGSAAGRPEMAGHDNI